MKAKCSLPHIFSQDGDPQSLSNLSLNNVDPNATPVAAANEDTDKDPANAGTDVKNNQVVL